MTIRAYIDWQQQGSSMIDLDDHDLHRAADAGVNLDDQASLGDWLERELKTQPRWFSHIVNDQWTERDQPELINPLLPEGDPPQWWIDLHPEPDS